MSVRVCALMTDGAVILGFLTAERMRVCVGSGLCATACEAGEWGARCKGFTADWVLLWLTGLNPSTNFPDVRCAAPAWPRNAPLTASYRLPFISIVFFMLLPKVFPVSLSATVCICIVPPPSNNRKYFNIGKNVLEHIGRKPPTRSKASRHVGCFFIVTSRRGWAYVPADRSTIAACKYGLKSLSALGPVT